MTDQVETKQVTWQDLEVAEEQESLPKGILILQGIDEEAWNEAVEKFYADEVRGVLIVQIARAFCVPPSAIVNTNVLPEDIENLQERTGDKTERLHFMYGRHLAPPCTPSRNSLTSTGPIPLPPRDNSDEDD